MKIIAFKYGESVFGENYIFEGGQKDRLLPISFVFYLIQVQNKNILVDVGCDDGAGFVMKRFKKPAEVLNAYGIEAASVTDVIITHAHHDHIEAVGPYRNAAIHMQKDEYENGKRYIPKNCRVNLFEDTYIVADNVMVKKIGGHSIGSCIVLAKEYVFCGDECYYQKNLTDKIMTGASCCKEKSLAFLEEYRQPRYKPLLFHDPCTLKGEVGFLRIQE